MNIAEVRPWALKGAEQRLVEIAEEAKAIFRNFPELRSKGRGFDVDGTPAGQRAKPPRRVRRRKLSAEARRRISEAVKARWAKQKGAGVASKVTRREANEARLPKAAGKAGTGSGRKGGPRRISAEARKRISQAQKARWAKVKAGKSEGAADNTSGHTLSRGQGSRNKK